MNSEYISDLTLEQYILNELPEEIYEQVKEAAHHDPKVKIRILKIEESNHGFYQAHPIELRVKQIEQLAGTASRTTNVVHTEKGTLFQQIFNFKTIFSLSSALVVVVALIVFMPNRDIPILDDDPNLELTRLKGGASLFIYKKVDEGTSLITDRSHVKAGDLIQLAYQGGNFSYGVIVSVDGNGVVTQHFPQSGATSPAIKKGGKVVFENAYELDNAPSFEKFYFFISKKPFKIQSVIERLQKIDVNNLEDDPIVDDFDIQYKSYILYKE